MTDQETLRILWEIDRLTGAYLEWSESVYGVSCCSEPNCAVCQIKALRKQLHGEPVEKKPLLDVV